MKINDYLLLFIFFFLSNFLCLGQSPMSNKIPQGKIERYIYNESKIFPGTEREVAVYIPEQLDSNKPACVYVQQDGLSKEYFTNSLDTLIANGDIPVTVGVFVRPGTVPVPIDSTIDRPNRSFEYDGLGDNYVRFILEEILPDVSNRYKLNLSTSGNDRCIGGGSSGGICAFNAAWERPDAFSRVYIASGSFVAFRGGNEFPILVRKTEAKPIRIFHMTGNDDMKNCAGDWTLFDQQMKEALDFSGYEHKFYFLEGKHGAGYTNHFAEGMKYLWKDWPEPVKAGSSAPRTQDIILPGESWQLAGTGYTAICGPACNANGEIFFTEPTNNKIYKIDTQGKINIFSENATYCNSLTFGADNKLYAVSEKTGDITVFDQKGKGRIYTSGIHGNYILSMPDGSFYASVSPSNNEAGEIWIVKDGKKQIVDKGLKKPSGIAMSPDHWLLAVADKESKRVYSYQVAPDGSLQNKEYYFWLHVPEWENFSEAESVCYDREGHLYVATNYGVQICANNGYTQVILPLPLKEKLSGLCIGGADFDILYAFYGDKIYKRKIKGHTVGAFTPWTKMVPRKL